MHPCDFQDDVVLEVLAYEERFSDSGGGLGGVVLASPEYTLYVSDPFQKNPKIAISRVLHGKPTPLALKTKKRSMKITDRFFTFLRAS